MSWSISAVGRPVAVAAKVTQDLSAYKCVDPEESVKQACAAALATAIAAQDPASVIRVNASGHQGDVRDNAGQKIGVHNTLKIEVEPIFGFVE